MSHYHDSKDLELLVEIETRHPGVQELRRAGRHRRRQDGAVPENTAKLIALAVACTTQCPYCLDVHTPAAKRAGATREEMPRWRSSRLR